MEKYSGFFVWGIFYVMMGCVTYYIVRTLFLTWKIKQDPVYVNGQIVSYYPKTPNNSGKVDIIMTYSFCVDNVIYTKNNQALTIDTIGLDKYYVGKDVPLIYYRGNPNYSEIDRYNKSLRK